jgi:D-alanyl-D-alanine carboxypeptidase (penicillin-binding protein 5/6)
VGVKTGFTPRAGKCLVAVAERDGGRVLLVLLNAPDRWRMAEEMLDAAFARRERSAPSRSP